MFYELWVLIALLTLNYTVQEVDGDSSALELVKMNDLGENFDIILDYNKVNLKYGSFLIYVCPAETDEDRKVTQHEGYSRCLFIKKETKKINHSIQCNTEVKPYFAVNALAHQCGRNGEGIRYVYLYHICWTVNTLYYVYIFNTDKEKGVRHIKTEHLPIYHVCLHNYQPIYVQHFLNVLSENSSGGRQRDELLMNPELDVNWQFIAHLYTDHLNSFSKTHNIPDQLIPHRLIPLNHVKSDYAKNTLNYYTNVRPLWKSRKSTWDRVDNLITKLGLNKDYDIRVYAGTYGNLGENMVIKEETNSLEIQVPVIWWKLIIHRKTRGIIFAMQNVPDGVPMATRELCENSICDSNGWTELNASGDGKSGIYCCEFNDSIKQILGLSSENFRIKNVFSFNDPPQVGFWEKTVDWWDDLKEYM